MKKKILRALSYVLVAVVAATLTLGVYVRFYQREPGKLEVLEDLIQERFIGEVDQTAIEDAAASAMVDALGDQWSGYLSAAQYASYQEQMSNSYVGIGITIQVREDNVGFDIVKVEPGGPAAEAGILPGDILIEAAGQDVAALGTGGAKEIIQGEVGTQVEIGVLRAGQELSFTVTRNQIVVIVASGRMLEDNIGLVTINNFNSRCAEESIAAIEALLAEGAEAIIFDVRFNPGGYANELVELLDYLLPEGELFRTVDYAGNEDVDVSDAACLEIPMAVLVNGSSISAAEFFAAALNDYDAAVVVGEPTCGKGYFQKTFSISDGSAVTISVGKYFTPNGVSLADEGGLTPDIPVVMETEAAALLYADLLEPEDDVQLQAALAALKAGWKEGFPGTNTGKSLDGKGIIHYNV